MRINIRTHYQTSLLSRLFAKNGKFESLEILKNKLKIEQGRSTVEIPFLDIDTVLVEDGFLWSTLTIDLHDGWACDLGGIKKSKAIELETAYHNYKHNFIKELARKISPTINTAFNESNTFLRKHQYIRHAKPNLWLNTYLKPLSSFLSKPDITDQLPEETLSQFNQLKPLLAGRHGYIAAFNKAYIQHQLKTYKDYFDSVENNPLTQNQRNVAQYPHD